MTYILISKTYGDDLIHPRKIVVAASDDRSKLEAMLVSRKAERDAYLAKYGDQIPDWAQCNLVEKEYIDEVPSV